MFEFEKMIERVTLAVKQGQADQIALLTKQFNTPIQNLVQSGWVTSKCSDILFINYTPLSVTTGGDIQVNNYTLQPGGYVGFMGNNAELNMDTYNVIFGPNATLCVVLKKLYTTPNK